MTDKNHQIMSMSRAELELFFHEIAGARDHDWQSDHNKTRRPWDLAKDYAAICLEDHFDLVYADRHMPKPAMHHNTPAMHRNASAAHRNAPAPAPHNGKPAAAHKGADRHMAMNNGHSNRGHFGGRR